MAYCSHCSLLVAIFLIVVRSFRGALVEGLSSLVHKWSEEFSIFDSLICTAKRNCSVTLLELVAEWSVVIHNLEETLREHLSDLGLYCERLLMRV